MKVAVAIDSMKGSLSSPEAGEAAALGIRRVFPDAQVSVHSIADGGEGTCEAILARRGGRRKSLSVCGPMGSPVTASYGILPDGRTAVLEMAAAAGLPLVPPDGRDPLRATTFGVGELIRDAIGEGCRRFIVGIGGSATNDGGLGMLQALGFRCVDVSGTEVPQGAIGLRDLVRIDASTAIPELSDCSFTVACDVSNPLCGETGCSAVFAPQKGATPRVVADMDRWLSAYADIAKGLDPSIDPRTPGAGAAGGLGFAFLAFLHATLRSGVRIVLEESGLEADVADADIVVTGEGRLDAQTALGKVPCGVAALARKHGKPVIAFAGCVDGDAAVCEACGFSACFPILRDVSSRAEAMEPERARANLSAAVEQAFRLIRTFR